VLQALGRLEARAAQALLELLGVASLDLVAADAEEEVGVGNLALDGLLGTQVEGLQHAGEPQLLEDGDEFILDGHGVLPCARSASPSTTPACSSRVAPRGPGPGARCS